MWWRKMSKRKGIFFTSDLHIGHANSIIFDKRPFKDLDHMHEVIVNNWNSCVKPEDVVYVLGDFGMGRNDEIKAITQRLNGTKVMILGNHDTNTYSMYDRGFDVVLNTAVFYLGDSRISMSHCPLPGIFREDVTGMKGGKPGENWHGESKQQRFTSQDLTVDFHLQGHIHSGPANDKPHFTDRQFDVGQPANGYRPVSISVIESWIANTKKEKK